MFVKAGTEISANPRESRQTAEQVSLVRIKRGVYRRRDAPLSGFETLAMASLVAPKAIVCLLSVLLFHDVKTQNPFEIWLAHRPKPKTLSLLLVHFSGASLTEASKLTLSKAYR